MKYFALASAMATALFVAVAGAQTDVSVSDDYSGAEIDAYAADEYPTKRRTRLGLDQLVQLTEAAEDAMANDAIDTASELFDQVLAAGNFRELDSERKHYVLSSAAEIASMRTDFVRARNLYKQSTRLRLAGSDDWMGRLNASWFLSDLDDALEALTVIAERWPGELMYVSEWAMDALLAHARDKSTKREERLLQALFDTGWQTDHGREPTHMWLRLIELLTEHDAVGQALSVSSRLRDPFAVVTMLSEERYARIIAAAPDWFNVHETMDAEIIEARLAVEDNAHLLAPSIELGEALLRAGRQSEALLVIETQMARAALKSLAGDKLDDAMTESVRALTTKALALIALDRYDEAGAALELAAQQILPKDRLADFLAVAHLQVCLGMPDAALATLERANGFRDDPRAGLVRYMAARSQQNFDAQKSALDALRVRAADAPIQVQRALLLAGETDAAAKLLISRLDDPTHRSGALLELQSMRDQIWPAADLNWRVQAQRLISRADVRESLAAVGGHVGEYDIYRWN